MVRNQVLDPRAAGVLVSELRELFFELTESRLQVSGVWQISVLVEVLLILCVSHVGDYFLELSAYGYEEETVF